MKASNNLHRVARCVVETVGLRARNWTVRGEVGIGAIARAAHSLKLRHKMAGSAVHRLASEWARQRSIGSLHFRNDRIAGCERSVDAGRVGSKKLAEASIEKQRLTNGIGRGCRIAFRRGGRSLT